MSRKERRRAGRPIARLRYVQGTTHPLVAAMCPDCDSDVALIESTPGYHRIEVRHDDDDERTPEQHMADIAGYTLHRLARLHDELEALGSQLSALSDWAAEHQPHLPHEWLGDAAEVVDELGCCVPELVRDIAATLPTRHRHLRTTPTQEA